MKITDIKDNKYILKLLSHSRIIGIGSTAICFLLKDGRVLKLFYSIYYKDFINNSHSNMLLRFEALSQINNDSYVGLDELLIKNGNCIGYLYPFINAKTLHSARYLYDIDKLVSRYSKLKKDTKQVSNRKFKLEDLHDKNILFGSIFYIIDLDKGYIADELSIDTIFHKNMQKINKVIIDSIFGVKVDEILEFTNSSINELYYKSIKSNSDLFFDFIESIKKECYPSNPTTLNLRRNVNFNKTYNTYYNYF